MLGYNGAGYYGMQINNNAPDAASKTIEADLLRGASCDVIHVTILTSDNYLQRSCWRGSCRQMRR